MTPPVLAETRGENGTGGSTTDNHNITRMTVHSFLQRAVDAAAREMGGGGRWLRFTVRTPAKWRPLVC